MTIIVVFIDYTKAFDSVKWDQLKAILIAYRLPMKLVNGIMSLYRGATARVRTSDGLTDVINLCRGVLQGDTFAPYLFVIVMDFIIRKVEEELGQEEAGFTFPPRVSSTSSTGTRENTREAAKQAMLVEKASDLLGKRFIGTLFADDTATLGGGIRKLLEVLQQVQRFLAIFEATGLIVGLGINVIKTEFLVATKGKLVTDKTVLRLLSGEELKIVRDYIFLGSYLVSELKDMRRRLKRGWEAVRRLAKFWRDPSVRTKVKMLFFSSICQSVFLYSSATWVLDAKMEAALNGCYTRMLRFVKGLSFEDHPTIEDIYGDMPTVVRLIAQRRLAMIGNAFQRKDVEQPMTRLMWELAARRQAQRKVWSAKSSRNFVDQLYEDLARVGLGHLDFGEVVALMQKPRVWAGIVDDICKAYPPPAPLARVGKRAPRKKQVPLTEEAASLYDLEIANRTPRVVRKPCRMRSSRRSIDKLARHLANAGRKKSAARVREELEDENFALSGVGRESYAGIFLNVQSTEVPSRARKGSWPLMGTFDGTETEGLSNGEETP